MAMTRKRAEKIAQLIVEQARKMAADPMWQRVEFVPTPEIAKGIEEAPALIVGCMPMGWSLSGCSTMLRVRRPVG